MNGNMENVEEQHVYGLETYKDHTFFGAGFYCNNFCFIEFVSFHMNLLFFNNLKRSSCLGLFSKFSHGPIKVFEEHHYMFFTFFEVSGHN